MVQADIWVFEISGSEVTAGDYWSETFGQPSPDTSLGGIDDLVLLGYDIQANETVVTVRRALNTGDQFDRVIAQGPVNMIWATEFSETLTFHSSGIVGQIQVDLTANATGEVATTRTSNPMTVRNIHAVFMLISLGILLDLSILAIRLLKVKNFWISYQVCHMALVTSAFMIAVAFIIVIIAHQRSELTTFWYPDGTKNVHFINGLVIWALIIISLTIGLLLFFKLRKKTMSRSLTFLRLAHRYNGYLIYILSRANIVLGTIFYKDGKWIVGVSIYLGTALAVQIALAFLVKRTKYIHFDDTKALDPKKEEQKKLFALINAGKSREDIIRELPRIKWVLCGNHIYDVGSWRHPGGDFIINEVIGRDVTRFLVGAYALESTTMTPHKHSAFAIKLLQKFEIGKVEGLESVLMPVQEKEGSSNISTKAHKWKLVGKTKISKTLCQFEFHCDDFVVKPYLFTGNSFGRHFVLSFRDNPGLQRLYTTAISLTPENHKLRELVFSSLGAPNHFHIDPSYHEPRPNLSFFIKNYPQTNGLSSKMHLLEELAAEHNSFIIEGPLGRGLELSPDFSGKMGIICGGTGILPFLDFLNFLLMKTIFDIHKENSPEKAEEMKSLGLNFNCFNNVQVKLYGAFADKSEIYGFDILAKLAEVSKIYGRNVFNAKLTKLDHEHIEKIDGRMTYEYFEKELDLDCNVYHMCGPPSMNYDIPKILLKLGISKHKIQLT